MKLTFVNHACCKVTTRTTSVLFDPWIEGPAFNAGWDLLVPTPYSFDWLMEDVSFIWISHEHPDHFSHRFLARVAERHADKVTILFQATRDRRVANYCRSLGLKVRELQDRVRAPLNHEVMVTCGNFDFYDSWLLLSDGHETVLNLNDCAMRDPADLTKLAALVGTPTVLLTQFSYAAWKGGRDNREFRLDAARAKLATLDAQARALHPRFALPFASMIYFSNVENSYLNDGINTPRDAATALAAAGTEPVVLFPGEAWEVGTPHDNEMSLRRYDSHYAAIGDLPLRPPGDSADLATLSQAFTAYSTRVFKRNAKSLIWLLSQISFLGAFQPLVIRLTDIDLLLSFSLLDGISSLPAGAAAPDVSMHSSSLLFVLQNEFGFDTLTVNGRFEASPEGFAKMTRALAIGSLNAMGLSISLRLLFNVHVVVILLRRLRGVLARLKGGATAQSALPS